MSERSHSSQPVPVRSWRRRFFPAMAGTLILVVGAGIWLQFFQAQPAASQTADDAGKASLTPSPANSSRPMAKVNNQTISYEVLARECVARHGTEVLDTLVNRLIIQQECETRGVSISAAEVDAEVRKTAEKFKLPLDTWYKMLETERHLTRDQYHQDVIWPMLALKKLAGQDVQITEDDMKKGFESNYGPRVKARLILVSGNSRNAAMIWEQCNANPDDFDRLAREYSADPNTRPLGGVIPPIRRHGDNKQIEEQAFRLKVGEISPVIQLPDVENRYVILKCEGFTEPVVTDIKDVWEDLYAQLVEERVQQSVAKIFTEIKDQARVDNYLTNRSTGGRVIQPTGALTPSATHSVQPAAASTPAPVRR